MADIFLSYASEDRARIEPMVGQLEGAGYSVWWDRQLRGGTQFSAEIENALTNATVVLVAWSHSSTKSRWVADEADLALETGNLLPVSLDGVRSPMGFRQLQTIDFSEWHGGDAPCVSALMVALEHHLKSGERTPYHGVPLPATPHTKSDASIAVLPFVNMSSDPEQSYFSDGISEELLNLLAKIRELTVIARTSSFAFKGSKKSISEIGAILGVGYLLEGSIRKAGNRVRITALLIETRNSTHLWSETYDRTLDDIFAIQDEISAAIVAELKGLILGGEHIRAPYIERTSDINAYEHYLLGQQLLNKRTRNAIERGRECFEKAVEKDPEYLPALIGVADAHILLSNHYSCYGTTPLKEAIAKGKPLLKMALDQDEGSVEAHGIMALYQQLEGNFGESLTHAKRALALNPNYSRGHTLLAFALEGLGAQETPVLSTRKDAVDLDPASLIGLFNLNVEYVKRLDFDRIESNLPRIEAIDPDTPMIAFFRTFIKTFKGEYKAALELLLAPDVAFSGRPFTTSTQMLATWLGHGETFESTDPNLALYYYAPMGDLEGARRVGPEVADKEGAKEDYQTALSLAIWQTLEGNQGEALSILIPFDEPDANKWGRHFSLELDSPGAGISLYLKSKLGKKDSARLHLEKLKSFHQRLLDDADGQHYVVDFIGAIVAVAEGEVNTCLDHLERQVQRTMCFALQFLRDPNFEGLVDEPRYQTLLSRVEAHYANERIAAEAAGLLPIPEELLARLKRG